MVKSLIVGKKQGLQKIPAELAKQTIKFAIENLTVEENKTSKRLYLRNKMYISNDKNLQLFLLQQHHELFTQDHLGFKSMLKKLQKDWFWIGIASNCKQYAINYATCRRTKTYNTKKQGLLNSLLILNRKWMDLLLDFVVQLPKCYGQNWMFQHILVVVDRLTKRRLYKLLETFKISEFIDAMYCWVFALHKFLLLIVNNHGN